jgi:NADH-quinone oxidoreductase subunit J
MSIEVALFVLIGGLAVAAAMMMLLSRNAVHSAMFLILNFVCVAFLYLMLDASFLSMVQIAVYAGAIMVLFLFVIMLLGAEQVVGEVREFRWFNPLVLTLALALLFAVGLALVESQLNDFEPPPPPAQLRVAHAAPDFPAADLYANGDLLFADVEPREATEYVEIEPGTYNLAINLAGDDPALAFPVGSVTVEAGQVLTALAHGGELAFDASGEVLLPEIAVLADDISTVDGRAGRLVIFNAGDNTVNLVDPGSDGVIEAEEVVTTYVAQLAPGAASEPLELNAEAVSWAFVPADNPDDITLRMSDFEIERGTTHLAVVGQYRDVVTTELRPELYRFTADAEPTFGGPRAVGELLFITYVLPFELVAVLLLAAMVGAIVLTQRQVKPKPGRPLRRKVSRPLTSVITSQVGHEVTEPRPQLEAPDETPEPAGD